MSVRKQRPFQIPFGFTRHFGVKNQNPTVGVAVIISLNNMWFMSSFEEQEIYHLLIISLSVYQFYFMYICTAACQEH